MNKFAAFLRGINVGGNKLIKMADLKKAFESSGFKNVKTILASGNVIFETLQTDADKIKIKIEDDLKKKFKTDISVMIRSMEDLNKLSTKDPFKKIEMTPQTRLYVTFLPEPVKRKHKTPFSPEDEHFTIVLLTGKEICSFLILTPDSNTLDLMGYIEKEYGKKVTTRNWNTIKKIVNS
jgi:uncharacterized protein (DUF1697 family)